MLAGITPKCWILALVVRDDGERLLLGDGAFEFKEKQQHFIANNYVNDTVEVQGNDGIMLAGQVRRSAAQSFDGFIADATVGGTDTETYRRQFLAFFRKNYYYTVIYIMPDGSAVKRQRGFIVDAPEVKELFRISPEYHVSLNFEDVNYYEYDENAEGEEIYSDSASIPMVNANSGGLVWDEYGVVWDGAAYNINGLLGDTFQQGVPSPNPDYPQAVQTVTGRQVLTLDGQEYEVNLGKNLLPIESSVSFNGITTTRNPDGTITMTGTTNTAWGWNWMTYQKPLSTPLPAGTYTFSVTEAVQNAPQFGITFWNQDKSANVSARIPSDSTSATVTIGFDAYYVSGAAAGSPALGSVINQTIGVQLELGSTATSYAPFVSVYGKNLFDGELVLGTYNGSGQAVSSTTQYRNSKPISITGGLQYAFSSNGASAYDLFFYDSSMNYLGYGYTTGVYTARSDAAYLNFATSGSVSAKPTQMMVEQNSAATDYEPCIPGPIELCKIGSNQDMIYRDNGKWWIKKSTSSLEINGSETWNFLSSYDTFSMSLPEIALQEWSASAPDVAMSKSFAAGNWYEMYNKSADNIIGSNNNNHQLRIRTTKFTSASEWTTWLSANHQTVRFVLSSPTIAQITNEALVAQLEAVNAELLESQTDASVVGSLPAILSFIGSESGTGGAVWDGDGGGGTATVTVGSIDNVYPVLTITGPANNPTIENVTTQTSIAYAGNVIEGQELVIDMNAQTAKLNGANVIGDISGDWLYFAPGDNKVAYATSNNDAPEATIEWSEVVG